MTHGAIPFDDVRGERHDQRFRANERRGNGGANENVVQRIVAQDLRDETKGDRARRLWTL